LYLQFYFHKYINFYLNLHINVYKYVYVCVSLHGTSGNRNEDVPDVANSLKAATASLQKAQLVDNLNHLLAQRPSPEEVPSRIIQFEDYVQVAETFMKQEYNRQPDTNATFRKLTPKMKMEIRAELNDFKKNEMEVHTESLKNTSFH
ncbi:hypothetical protein HMI54_005149, partial [Coelomomyces lativittatus]